MSKYGVHENYKPKVAEKETTKYPPACVDCKYHAQIPSLSPDKSRTLLHKCKHPDLVVTHFDVVTGKYDEYKHCRALRSSEKKCGPDGFYFESR